MKISTSMGLELETVTGNEYWYVVHFSNDIDNYLRSLQYCDSQRYFKRIRLKDKVEIAERLLLRGGYLYRSKLTGKLEVV